MFGFSPPQGLQLWHKVLGEHFASQLWYCSLRQKSRGQRHYGTLIFASNRQDEGPSSR
nr:Hypothetical protein [Aeromonas sp.]